MTTIYDDYVWSGGCERFGDYKGYQDWQKYQPPTFPSIPIPKEQKKIILPETSTKEKIKELEKKLSDMKKANFTRDDKIAEFMRHQDRLIKLVENLTDECLKLKEDNGKLHKENKNIKELLNRYNRFDIMEINEDG